MPTPRLYKDHAARQAAYRTRRRQARYAELLQKGLPALPAIAAMPGGVRWQQATTTAARLLADTIQEMQDYFDDRSEEWQESQRGEEHQQRIDSIQEIADMLDTVW